MNVCIVTTDLMGPIKNGGVGTACFYLAKNLADKYGRCDILYVNSVFHTNMSLKKNWTEYYSKKRINLLSLKLTDHIIDHGFSYTKLAYMAYESLKDSKYDIIIFPEMHGVGYYCFWSKKVGLSFQDTKLITMYHGPTEWHHKYNDVTATDINELILYQIEKKSSQLCDQIYFSTQHAKKTAIEMGYAPPEISKNSEVILYPFAEGLLENKVKNKKINEICFFGRTEYRKGIENFLDAVVASREELKQKNIKITILGKTNVAGSLYQTDYFSHWSKAHNIDLNIQSNLDQPEALAYLKNNKCLAIIPSLEETMGYTLIECITNNIPFLCSNIPSFNEILKSLKVKETNLMFNVDDVSDLERKIKKSLSLPPVIVKHKKLESEINKKWTSSLEKVLTRKTKPKPSTTKAKVSVCIPHYNRPDFLNQLLKSLKPIENIIGEILIFDNNSKSKESIKFLNKISLNKKIKVYRGNKNYGPGYARNRLAEYSKFENILFVDDDNILDAAIFEKLYTNMQGRKDWDIIASPLKKFNDNVFFTEKITNNFPDSFAELNKIVKTVWIPALSDINVNLNFNVAADANFLIKKKHFLEVGGFNEGLNYGEDQVFLIKSHLKSGQYVICPESFIFYRNHNHNLSHKDINLEQHRKVVSDALAAELKSPALAEYLLFNSKIFFNKTKKSVKQKLGQIQQLNNFQKLNKNQKNLIKLQQLLVNKSEVSNGLLEVDLSNYKYKSSDIPIELKDMRVLITLKVLALKKSTIILNNNRLKISKGESVIEVKISDTSKMKLKLSSKNLDSIKIENCYIDQIKA